MDGRRRQKDKHAGRQVAGAEIGERQRHRESATDRQNDRHRQMETTEGLTCRLEERQANRQTDRDRE